jgi:shikimate dehydrogenase
MIISGATKMLVLIGDPVAQSLSPVMHNGWIADHGIDAVYTALPLKSDDAETEIRALCRFGFAGANVTVPHKRAAASAADRSEGAVANVLRWDDDGTVSGFNTDGLGFLDALAEAAPNWRERVRRVLMLGAGGAASAIAEALGPYAETITFANRTQARADAAADALRVGRVLRWDDLERGFANADLIVQATTLGTAAAASPDWPLAAAKPDTICADIVYRPIETGFLSAARARGLPTMDGLGMLIHQGARAFELWFGVKPDIEKARRRLIEALG